MKNTPKTEQISPLPNTKAKKRRLFESLYDPQNSKTFVRHPWQKDEWIEQSLLADILKGLPQPSVSGREACEIFSAPTKRENTEETGEHEAGKQIILVLHQRGRNNILKG
jgi:hypothetical protein